ncbi:MAG: YceI family protein [bacterium]|nr:YceI family protein [bacterium]
MRKLILALVVITLGLALMAQASTWDFDKSHSSIKFKVKHMAISTVWGSFDSFTGLVTLDDKDMTKSKVEVTIDATSINTNEPKRDEHLKSADFFDVTKFPTAKFVSTKIEKVPDGLMITGDLTMKDVTKSVMLMVEGPTPPIKDPWGGVRIGASATARINRYDWGLTWNKAIEAGNFLVGQDVDLIFEVELVKKI